MRDFILAVTKRIDLLKQNSHFARNFAVFVLLFLQVSFPGPVMGRLFPKPRSSWKLKLFHSHPGEGRNLSASRTKPTSMGGSLWMVGQILESLKISFDCWAGIQTADG